MKISEAMNRMLDLPAYRPKQGCVTMHPATLEAYENEGLTFGERCTEPRPAIFVETSLRIEPGILRFIGRSEPDGGILDLEIDSGFRAEP